ncbi:MAG: EF-P lysine aminoacylase EpmA [Acetobacteraceae bacterium]
MLFCPSVADRLPLLRRRLLVIKAIRAFFEARNYLEVETPYLVPNPGEEVHLKCFGTYLMTPDGQILTRYLHTSPEFAMKRLMAELKSPLFQLARVWRNGEQSATHLPEFTMLEWYRPHASLSDLMDETEALIRCTCPPIFSYHGHEIDLTEPFERMTVNEAFQRYVGVDLLTIGEEVSALAHAAGTSLRAGESWEDLFFRLMLERIEPQIGRTRPCFLTHWPVAQAALARRDPEDDRVALRFELYLAGIELANAFEELTDAVEQRARFERDRLRRMALTPDQNWPLDEAFLSALPDMPPCSGIALGVDRLVMLAASTTEIANIRWIE